MGKTKKLLGGIGLVAGTTIGAGMLALPVVTGFLGFFPSVFLFIFYWFFMYFTSLLFLEVNLWIEGEHNNFLSMAKKTVGKRGEALCFVLYLFLLYALNTAYMAGSSSILVGFLNAEFSLGISKVAGMLPLLGVFGYFVTQGTRKVDLMNRVLMIGLTLIYFCMIFSIFPYVKEGPLHHVDWLMAPIALSFVATSFGFHVVIPSLVEYFERDVKLLKKALFWGSFLPLMVYTLWEVVSLGVIPLEGSFSIKEGFLKGWDGASLLVEVIQKPEVAFFARIFSFFAIITSFLGVSLSLNDFLADGFKIKKEGKGRLYLFLMTFLPPFLIVLYDPRAFLNALEYAGVFGVVVLLALFPAWMAWNGRYFHHFKGKYKAPFGKAGLLIVMGLSFIIIGIEIFNKVYG